MDSWTNIAPTKKREIAMNTKDAIVYCMRKRKKKFLKIGKGFYCL